METVSWLLACAIKAGVLLAASWVGAALLRRGAAAARHQIWTLGVVGALSLPGLCWVVPSLAPSSDTAAIAGIRSLEAPAVFVTSGPVTAAAPTWPMWLALVWAAGAAVVAVRLLRGHLAARRLVRSAEPNVGEVWTAAMVDAAASLGLARRIRLLRSETIGSPMTIGILRPRVLLPAAAEAWSPERLRAVLVHELGHVRRGDTVIQLAAQLGCALYWWNPLAWLAAARLRIEREHACDDLVLGAGVLPSSYAADLLDVAQAVSRTSRTHAGAICMADRSWTEARLHRILDATAPRRPLRARFRLAVRGLAVAAAVTLACTSSPPARPSPAPAPTVTTPGASPSLLSVGAPSVRGSGNLRPPGVQDALDLSHVANEVKSRLGNLEQCYARRLAVEPTLAGTVIIHWTIAATGEVVEQCITEDTVDDAEIRACVNQLVDEGGFPVPHAGAVDVSFPFVFAPALRV